MEPRAPDDALARLDLAARATDRPRLRLGVGAAVVLLIAALVTAVIVSAIGQQAGHQVIRPGGSSADSSAGTGSTGTGSSATGSSAPPWSSEPPRAGGSASRATGSPTTLIFVHVLGAVRRSGLFQLHEGARVMDAVAAAGGFTETADPAAVNLARIVGDGEQLYVPVLGEAQPGAPPGAAVGNGNPAGGAGTGNGPSAPTGKINLNTAGVAELETLPRIGPAMAQRIIDFRDANGRFASIDDLRNITGIGEKTFEGLKDLVTV
jgi:competence protein ComEA